MNSNKGSHLVSSETDDQQIKTPQVTRPKCCPGGRLFQKMLQDVLKQDNIQAKAKDEFILARRKAANSSTVADNLTEAPSILSNDQSTPNATVTNSALENCNRKTYPKNNHIKSEDANKGHAQSNFLDHPISVKGKVRYSYENEHRTSRIENIEISKKDVNNSHKRTQNDWKSERKLSRDDTNRNFNECASSYRNGTSIQSSSVNHPTKNVDEKLHDVGNTLSKSKKDEDDGWGEIDLEDSRKGKGDIDDGWDNISKTEDGGLDSIKQADLSQTSSRHTKSPKNKYIDHPFQHGASTQSIAVSNKGNQCPNSKENNYKRSVSMPLAEPANFSGRSRQNFHGKDNYQYNSELHSQPASSVKQDFNDRNHKQNSISTLSAQSSSIQKSVKQNLNSKKTDEDFAYGKTELEKEKKPGTNDTSQVNKEEELGWPKLDLDKDRRHSYDDGDGWNDENSSKEKKQELSSNRTLPYQRSISTPLAQSSTFANNRNGEEPSKNRHYNDNARGDCSANLPHSDRSKFEQNKRFPSKSQFPRSKSFRDKTNFRDENIDADYISKKNVNHANYQDSGLRAVDDCNAGFSGAYNRKQSCHASSNYNDKKSFNKSRGQDSNRIGHSNPNTSTSNWNKAWRENEDPQMEANQDIGCDSESIMPEPCRHNPNRSETILQEEKSHLMDKVQGVDSSDEWCTMSEASEVSTVVLENKSSSNLERERIVVQPVTESLTITLSYPKKENDLVDSKPIKDTSQNSCAYKKIDYEMLQTAYLDPLESFFASCSEPSIPAPWSATNLDPECNAEVSKAVYLIENPTSVSSDCSSFTELDPVESQDSCELLDEIPDARQLQEITSFLNDLEAEKSMPGHISKKIFQDVVNVVKYYVKGYIVYSYGSYNSGLAVSTSNYNLALKAEVTPKNSFLLQLQKTLSKGLQGYQVEPFDEDKNPKKSKICFTETKTGIMCEMIYFGSCVSNYRKMDILLKDVCQFDPRIKTLLIATRIWAEVCLINEPEEGKLHSLGYTLLMLHFLQSLEKPLLPILVVDLSLKNWGLDPLEVKNESSIGELWLSFLKYYSKEFNWKENVVTIHSKPTVLKSSKSWDLSLITIEDPFSQKNIADTVVSPECAEGIFSCFKASYQYFSTPVDYEDSDSSDSGITGSLANNSKKEIFSFNDISFDQNLPSVCEVCEELNEPCKKCRPSKEVILQPLSPLSPLSLDCVNTALYDVYNEFILPDSKIEGRKAFVRDLESYVKQMDPSAKLTLFGSSVNAFGFKRSDLDICMTLSRKPRSNIESAALLRNLVRHLRKRPQLYDNVFGLYHAKIPIVKFHFIDEDWNCDLSLYNVLAVHNSKLLCRYALFDERCRVLGCAMKLLAKKACLDDTRSLSSYSYILAVIHYLQQVEPPVLPVLPVEDKKVFEEKLEVPKEVECHNYWFYEDVEKLKNRYLPDPKNVSSVGELWLGLLDFYARYDGVNAVTITQKEPLPSASLRRCARLLNIQDPFLAKDNLGCILTDSRADQTRKVLGRARLLFGKEIHKDWRHDPKKYFFSSSNLTGQFIKDVECRGCGGFGHEKSDCLKADPFKYSKFRHRIPYKTKRRPYIRKV